MQQSLGFLKMQIQWLLLQQRAVSHRLHQCWNKITGRASHHETSNWLYHHRFHVKTFKTSQFRQLAPPSLLQEKCIISYLTRGCQNSLHSGRLDHSSLIWFVTFQSITFSYPWDIFHPLSPPEFLTRLRTRFSYFEQSWVPWLLSAHFLLAGFNHLFTL